MNVIAKSQHLKLNSRNISETIKNRKYSEESNSQSNSRGDTGGTSRSFKRSRNPLGTWGTPSTCITLLSSFSRESLNGPLGPTGPCAARGPASPFYPRVPPGSLRWFRSTRWTCGSRDFRIPGIPAAQREVYLQDLESFFTFCLGMLWTTKYCKENPSFFLELQSNSSLRTFC